MTRSRLLFLRFIYRFQYAATTSRKKLNDERQVFVRGNEAGLESEVFRRNFPALRSEFRAAENCGIRVWSRQI
ncbi:hypothetical protein K0M31_000603 [Melipona bicolor]|uniref:Uncharacterized protein n=1 Tax=Melipona bicolor TaxID=60889 RepID=A0AA40GE18_9HYME|nr:hypothetical protein K0M31_000603 [Melipona bicolor]